MKIKFKDKNKRFGITFYLPLRAIKLIKYSGEMKELDVDKLYKALKKFRKSNPSFVFLEVKTKEGEEIIIKI